MLRMLVGLLGKLPDELRQLVRHVVRRRVQFWVQGRMRERLRLELLGRVQLFVLVDMLRMLRMHRVVLGRMHRRMFRLVQVDVLVDLPVDVPVDVLGTIEIGENMAKTYEPARETVDYLQRLAYEADGMRETIDYIVAAHAGDKDASVVEGAPFRALAAQCAQASAAYRVARDEFQASMPEWAAGMPWSLDFASGVCTVEDGR